MIIWVKSMKFNKRRYVKKFNYIGLCISLVFISLVLYSSRLQITNHDIYTGEVNTNTIKQRKLPAPRGLIMDRNGIVLASTEYQNDLYIIPHYFHDNIDIICSNLKVNCDILNWKIDHFPLNRFLIAKNIPDNLAAGYRTIPGLYVFHFSKRDYNDETATAHIVGYVGKIGRNLLETNEDSLYADDDFVGQAGLENIYNHEIHGLNGAEQYVVQANGLELLSPNKFLTKEQTNIQPVKGNNLVLSIDDRLQLALAMAMGNNKGGAAIVDIHTGAVLALYSNPAFDPKHIRNVFGNPDHPLMNRALSSFAPGSTFKLITALAALEMGIIDPHTKLECHGSYAFGGRVWHCWKHEGHGAIDMHDAIMHSCDIYFYQLAQKVGLSNIIKYAKMLGIGEATGIDLDVESSGRLPSIKGSSPGVLLNTVIGQGVVQVSPLQLANAYATMINGGELHIPRLVSGEVIVRKNNPFKRSSIDFLMQALYDVVNTEGGTAYYGRSNIIEAAGKTGTAQVAGLDKKKKDNAWFAGYYPVVEPQIAVAVFVEQGEHGSLVAPIAFKAIEEYSKNHAPISRSPQN